MKEVLDNPVTKIVVGVTIAVLAAYLIGLSGFAWGTLHERVVKNEAISANTKSRLTKLEVEVMYGREETRDRLGRIEKKIDAILEKR